MLGYFPSPYPDELFISICARYRQRTGIASHYLRLQLFGSDQVYIVHDFPSHLEKFLAVLPTGHGYSIERIIDGHSLFPFYRPFLSPDIAHSVAERLRGNHQTPIHGLIGRRLSRIAKIHHLRYCPGCVEDDRSHFGETYWHRSHQLEGIETCPVHHATLVDSKIEIPETSNRWDFISADEAVELSSPEHLKIGDPYSRASIQLAKDAAWLLSYPVINPDTWQIKFNYGKIIMKIRPIYSKEKQSIDHLQLGADLENYYTAELLSHLGCEILPTPRESWIFHLVSQMGAGTIHPIHHLLMMQFLGHTPETFFEYFHNSGLIRRFTLPPDISRQKPS